MLIVATNIILCREKGRWTTVGVTTHGMYKVNIARGNVRSLNSNTLAYIMHIYVHWDSYYEKL